MPLTRLLDTSSDSLHVSIAGFEVVRRFFVNLHLGWSKQKGLAGIVMQHELRNKQVYKTLVKKPLR
jgi:hypothetical protein